VTDADDEVDNVERFPAQLLPKYPRKVGAV
jgi:hypothetical protein